MVATRNLTPRSSRCWRNSGAPLLFHRAGRSIPIAAARVSAAHRFQAGIDSGGLPVNLLLDDWRARRAFDLRVDLSPNEKGESQEV